MREIKTITETGEELRNWKMDGSRYWRDCWEDTQCGVCPYAIEYRAYTVKHVETGEEAWICRDCIEKFYPRNYRDHNMAFNAIDLGDTLKQILEPEAIEFAHGLGKINDKSRDFYLNIIQWRGELSLRQLSWKRKIECRIKEVLW
jgi:hypothetical protein